jgi:formylglycine-generating enzyme required for sulfatase activity
MSVEGKAAVGEARGDVPAKLVEMRKIYEAETAKLAEAREAKERELRAKYDEALAGHVKRLTQSRKIEEALAVEEWREPYRVREEEAAEPEMVAGVEGGPAAGVVPAPGAPGNRLTLAEIDRGELGSELEIILPGGIPMVFCWCPPGKFLMGSPPDEEGREQVQPNGLQPDETQHLVELTKGYWLGKYEVTQAQWTTLMQTTVQEQYALVPNRDAEIMFRLSGIGPDQPMYFVSWEESETFCKQLGRKFRTPGRWEFVLPTEAQWEYACRAGTTGPYGGTGVVEEMGWIAGNSGRTTHPVGQKKSNAWGLHDMHGNVWEWCADLYGEHPGQVMVDPKGEKSGVNVYRGGSWSNSPARARSAGRIAFAKHSRGSSLGFRVALSPK